MKSLRQLCAAVVLTLTLCLSASADGQMGTGVADGQIPTTVAGQISTGRADGNMSTPVAGQMDTTIAGQMETLSSIASPVDPATQIALTLWHSVLSLF